MVALIVPVISKIIDALVQGGQLKADEAKAAQVALAQAQTQRDQTFATFISNTSSIVYTLMRNAIVGIFAASLVVPHWGQTVAANAGAMPPYFWAIIGWEFYGNQAMYALPWFRGGNGNGTSSPTVASLPTPPTPTSPVSPEPSDRG